MIFEKPEPCFITEHSKWLYKLIRSLNVRETDEKITYTKDNQLFLWYNKIKGELLINESLIKKLQEYDFNKIESKILVLDEFQQYFNITTKKTSLFKITDVVNSFIDCLEIIDEDLLDEYVLDLLGYTGNNKFMLIEKSHLILTLIIKVLNEGWEPDWDNTNQKKWYPWFNMQSGGFGFSAALYDGWNTHSSIGSLLCFKSQELCEYAATQFKSEYADYMLNR